MTTPLLATKLYIPAVRPLRSVVPRPRLVKKLNEGLCQKLTLLSASAGFGKTTLLSEWIAGQSENLRFAWLSLDESDNDLSRFLTYLIAALQTIDSEIGQRALVALRSPGTVSTEMILTILLNELAEITDRLVLVLDDYHLIESQPIDRVLRFLFDHLPTQMHLVIASRIDPSLPLSRLRARGQMIELRADDLRFTPDEVADFLRLKGFNLSAQDVAALGTRTEGWIAGLHLAAISMQGSGNAPRFVRSFTGSNRFILDYLREEVLALQPPKTRDFLLQTSLLNRLSGALCDALTGRDDGDEMLEGLDRENLFIIPLDHERRWYRYHHLFADLLRQRLRQTQPDLIPTLHRRAGEWYANQNHHLEAVRHALAGNDFERAADLIEANGLELIGQGAFATVRQWINNLPDDVVANRPYLCVYHAWASNFTQQLEAIESYLEDAQRALQSLEPAADENMTKDLHGHIATLQAWDARRQRDNPRAIDLLKQAVEFLGDRNPFARTFADLNLGLAYMDDGELIHAADSFRNAISQGRVSGNELTSLMATSYLAAILILQGRLHEAAKLCRTAIRDQLKRHEKPPPTLCLIYLRLGWVLAEWNDVDGYFANVSQGVILADRIGFDSVVTAGSLSMAWYQQLLATQGTSIKFSDDVATIVDRVMAVDNGASEASHSSDSENDISAIMTRNTEVYLVDDAYFEVWPGLSRIAAAKKLAEEDKVEEALALLEQIYDSAQAVEGAGLMIEARSSASLIHQSQGDIDRAVEALEDALYLGEPRGYVRTFVDRDVPMAQILNRAAARGIMPDYARKLLAAFGASDQDATPTSPQPLIEPLSPRELEVLKLVAQGLSNREIGEKLFLALSTVKGHNRNIFDKLQVQRRTEAVARARDLGLV